MHAMYQGVVASLSQDHTEKQITVYTQKCSFYVDSSKFLTELPRANSKNVSQNSYIETFDTTDSFLDLHLSLDRAFTLKYFQV